MSLQPKLHRQAFWESLVQNMAFDDLISLQNAISARKLQLKNLFNILELFADEIFITIFSFCNVSTVITASKVCKRWNRIIKDNHLWKSLFHSHHSSLVKSHYTNDSRNYSYHHYIDKRKRGIPGIMSLSQEWKMIYQKHFKTRKNWKLGKYSSVKRIETGTLCMEFDDFHVASVNSEEGVLMDISGQCLVRFTGEHRAAITAIKFNRDHVVTASRDCTIRIWCKSTGKCIRTLLGHEGEVGVIEFHNNRIVSGSEDATIKIWDFDGLCNSLVGHGGGIMCLQFNQDMVVSASADHTIKTWNILSGEMLSSIDLPCGHVFTLRFDHQSIVAGDTEGNILIWDLNGNFKRKLTGHSKSVLCLQFDSEKIVSGSADKTIKVWDKTSGYCMYTINAHGDMFKTEEFSEYKHDETMAGIMFKSMIDDNVDSTISQAKSLLNSWSNAPIEFKLEIAPAAEVNIDSERRINQLKLKQQLAESRRQLMEQERKLALERKLEKREKKLKELQLEREIEKINLIKKKTRSLIKKEQQITKEIMESTMTKSIQDSIQEKKEQKLLEMEKLASQKCKISNLREQKLVISIWKRKIQQKHKVLQELQTISIFKILNQSFNYWKNTSFLKSKARKLLQLQEAMRIENEKIQKATLHHQNRLFKAAFAGWTKFHSIQSQLKLLESENEKRISSTTAFLQKLDIGTTSSSISTTKSTSATARVKRSEKDEKLLKQMEQREAERLKKKQILEEKRQLKQQQLILEKKQREERQRLQEEQRKLQLQQEEQLAKERMQEIERIKQEQKRILLQKKRVADQYYKDQLERKVLAGFQKNAQLNRETENRVGFGHESKLMKSCFGSFKVKMQKILENRQIEADHLAILLLKRKSLSVWRVSNEIIATNLDDSDKLCRFLTRKRVFKHVLEKFKIKKQQRMEKTLVLEHKSLKLDQRQVFC